MIRDCHCWYTDDCAVSSVWYGERPGQSAEAAAAAGVVAAAAVAGAGVGCARTTTGAAAATEAAAADAETRSRSSAATSACSFASDDSSCAPRAVCASSRRCSLATIASYFGGTTTVSWPSMYWPMTRPPRMNGPSTVATSTWREHGGVGREERGIAQASAQCGGRTQGSRSLDPDRPN